MNFNPAAAIGAVVRQVASREHLGKPARVVIAGRHYDTEIDDLWDALTNGERIPRWFLPISGDLKLGGRYQFKGNAGGEITRCEPPRLLSVTWEYGSEVSWLNVTLASDAAGGTGLELEHIAHVSDERWDQFGPGAVGVGWDLGLIGLARHLASGAAVDRAAAFAWQTSAEGKATMRAYSEAWGEASIAAGTDAAAAHAAARRTTAFYTGEPQGGGG
jgi:uncharacterized protein YndB with AHSA1/START domain